MGRPIYIYRLAELKTLTPMRASDTETLRIAQPTFRVWLSRDETTIRIEEKSPNTDTWRDVETYPAR